MKFLDAITPASAARRRIIALCALVVAILAAAGTLTWMRTPPLVLVLPLKIALVVCSLLLIVWLPPVHDDD